MLLLIIGLVLFFGIHLVRVLVPNFRTSFITERGEGIWKGIYSLVSLVGLVLIIWGYARYGDPAQLYAPLVKANRTGYAFVTITKGRDPCCIFAL